MLQCLGLNCGHFENGKVKFFPVYLSQFFTGKISVDRNINSSKSV